jgi:ABC-2 type transport system permease protein
MLCYVVRRSSVTAESASTYVANRRARSTRRAQPTLPRMIAGVLAQTLRPAQDGPPQELLAQVQLQLLLTRLSPNTLFAEALLAILNPSTRVLGLVLPIQLYGAIVGAPLPLDQSLILIWPHITGLIAATILLFALGYVLFQRQEIRA